MVILNLLVVGNAKIYNVYPESFFSALSKIGGFFAIIKVISLISFFHELLFEKKVSMEMQNHGNFPSSEQAADRSDQEIRIEMKNLLSVETFISMHAQIKKHEALI